VKGRHGEGKEDGEEDGEEGGRASKADREEPLEKAVPKGGTAKK
jgi:hypothetical protein